VVVIEGGVAGAVREEMMRLLPDMRAEILGSRRASAGMAPRVAGALSEADVRRIVRDEISRLAGPVGGQ
jgi:hypothetical protein